MKQKNLSGDAILVIVLNKKYISQVKITIKYLQATDF